MRYRCPNCGRTQTRKRDDLTKVNSQKLLDKWLLDSFHLNDFSLWRKMSVRTLQRQFEKLPLREYRPPVKPMTDGLVIILDAIGVDDGCVLLIARTKKQILTWGYFTKETYQAWREILQQLGGVPLVIVSDGKRGLIKAVSEIFSTVKRQRCQFHVQEYILKRLTKHPKSQAAQDLRRLVCLLTKVKSKTDGKNWLIAFKHWYLDYQEYLSEQTFHPFPYSGKHHWHYTHGRVRTCFNHLKRSIPEVFTYLIIPQTPNTTNHLEGGINSQLRNLLKEHRGLNIKKRRYLLSLYLHYHVIHHS